MRQPEKAGTKTVKTKLLMTTTISFVNNVFVIPASIHQLLVLSAKDVSESSMLSVEMFNEI